MATKTIICPLNVTEYQSSFSKSGSIWTGQALFSVPSGYIFDGLTAFTQTTSDYYITVKRPNSPFTINCINNTDWCYFRYTNDVASKRYIQFGLLAGAGVSDTIFNYDWELTANVVQTAMTKAITQNCTNCTTNAPQTIADTDTTITITATAANDYYFETAPQIVFKDANDTTLLNAVFTIAANGLTASVTVDLTQLTFADIDTITLNAAAVAIPTRLPLTQNISHFTTNAPQYVYETDTTVTITATANSGYIFDTRNMPRVVTYDINGAVDRYDFTASNDRLTASVSFNPSLWNWNVISDVQLIGTAVAIPNAIGITQNCINCTTDAPQYVDVYDTDLTVTATANSGYIFDTAPQIRFTDANGNTAFDTDGNLAVYPFVISQNAAVADITVDVDLLDFSTMTNAVITATAAAAAVSVNVVTTVQNAVLNGLPQTVYVDSVLALTATANSGYKFDTAPQVYILDANGNPYVVEFALSQNDTVAQCTVNLGGYSLDNHSTVTITAIANAVTPYVDKYGTINVYKVTTQNLAEFAQRRMFVETISQPSDPAPTYEKIDLGVYVHSVKRLYCSVGETLQNVLKCGNYDTQINVQTPTNDTVNIDCGTVAIPTPNNDITDYQSEISIFLPFVGMQSVPVDLVGKTISLHYICNIVTADAVAILEYDNIKFADYICNVASDIIFMTNENYGAVRERGDIGNNSEVLRGLQPYIIVKYFDSENGKIYNNDAKRIALNQTVGFAQITEITEFVNAEITDSEKTMLINALANGVIFNAIV